MPEGDARLRPFLLALLIAAGCAEDGRVAGTSTSVGTAIGGRALTAAGGPAAGAAIRVRSAHLEIRSAAAGYPVLDSTRADAEGRFSLSSDLPGEFHLEIAWPAPESGAGEGYHAHVDRKPQAGFGDRILAGTGAVKGRVRAPAKTATWVGLEGGAFLRMASPADSAGAEFRLEGVPPGNRKVVVIYLPEDGNAKVFPVEDRVIVRSGETADIGLVGD